MSKKKIEVDKMLTNTSYPTSIIAVKEHLKTLPDTKAKILYVTEAKTEYLLNKPNFELDWGTPFDKQCDYQITLLKEQLKFEKEKPPAIKQPQPVKQYKLSSNLTKADYIRIVNALHELQCFQNENGTWPTKEEIMTAFGNLVNIDLSNYSNALNKAFNSTVSEEKNTEIFEKMRQKTKELYNSRQKPPKK